MLSGNAKGTRELPPRTCRGVFGALGERSGSAKSSFRTDPRGVLCASTCCIACAMRVRVGVFVRVSAHPHINNPKPHVSFRRIAAAEVRCNQNEANKHTDACDGRACMRSC